MGLFKTKRMRLLDLFYSRRPELRAAPIVEDINPDEFEGPALVVVPLVPAWQEPTYSERRPYAAAIHNYIRNAGLEAERFSPTQEECAQYKLTAGETVFIVTQSV